MTRASRRHTQAQTERQPEWQHAAPSSRPTSGGWRRLLVLLALGAILVCVAGWFRPRVGSHRVPRIPPVETAELLPAVAKEIHERQEAIAQHPDAPSAWGEYGLVLLAHGLRKEAGDCFVEAEILEPENFRWPYYLGMTMGVWDAELSLHAFERAVEKDPTRLSVRLRLAEWLFDLRRLEDCERHVRVALKQNPESARAQLLQARLLFERGAMRESSMWAQRAAGSPQGNRRDVHELLARIYQRLGDRDAAAVEIEQTEMLPPDVVVWDDPEMGFGDKYLRDASMLNTLAEISRARGNMEVCLQRLRQIVKSEPNNVIAQQKLAATLVEVKRYDEAQKFLDQALSEHPDSADLLYLRGQVHLARGQRDLARQCFERAIELKPDYERAFTALGQVRIESGDPGAAIAALREAIRLRPTSVEAYRSLGQALAATKQFDEAVESLRQAAELDPADDALRRQLIETLQDGRSNNNDHE